MFDSKVRFFYNDNDGKKSDLKTDEWLNNQIGWQYTIIKSNFNI